MERLQNITLTEQDLRELNIPFSPNPVDFTEVKVDLTPGVLLDDLVRELHITWFPTYAGDGRRDFSEEQLRKYILYLVQERIKQIAGERYDRTVRIPAGVFQLLGSIYSYVDKVKGIVLVPSQGFEAIERDDDVNQVARVMHMLLPTTCNMPVEKEGSVPCAMITTVIEDRVLAYDEVTLLDALFSTILNRDMLSRVYGDPRVEYCHVGALIPAVQYLAYGSRR